MKNLFLSICILLYVNANAQTDSSKTKLFELKLDNNAQSLKTIVWKDNKTKITFFKADFDLDADGSPRAYNPQNTGLLHNANGKDNGKLDGNWIAIVLQNKEPVIQDSAAPNPGYYISTTSLELSGYKKTDAKRYVDAEKFPYVALPGGKARKYAQMGMKYGDVCLVVNMKNKKSMYALFADVGPGAIAGEGSIYLANQLGIKTFIDKKGRIRGGTDAKDVLYICMPKSGKKTNDTISLNEIEELGNKASATYGGKAKLIEDIMKMAE